MAEALFFFRFARAVGTVRIVSEGVALPEGNIGVLSAAEVGSNKDRGFWGGRKADSDRFVST